MFCPVLPQGWQTQYEGPLLIGQIWTPCSPNQHAFVRAVSVSLTSGEIRWQSSTGMSLVCFVGTHLHPPDCPAPIKARHRTDQRQPFSTWVALALGRTSVDRWRSQRVGTGAEWRRGGRRLSGTLLHIVPSGASPSWGQDHWSKHTMLSGISQMQHSWGPPRCSLSGTRAMGGAHCAKLMVEIHCLAAEFLISLIPKLSAPPKNNNSRRALKASLMVEVKRDFDAVVCLIF